MCNDFYLCKMDESASIRFKVSFIILRRESIENCFSHDGLIDFNEIISRIKNREGTSERCDTLLQTEANSNKLQHKKDRGSPITEIPAHSRGSVFHIAKCLCKRALSITLLILSIYVVLDFVSHLIQLYLVDLSHMNAYMINESTKKDSKNIIHNAAFTRMNNSTK